MACPYFMPTEKIDDAGWLHPSRLPLGGGWKGRCTAPGHENEIPSDQQIHECCNLGYASACEFRPKECEFDSVRFAVMKETEDRIVVCYACEREHRPAAHGYVEYDKVGHWWRPHSDARIQKMAECYLAAYLTRKNTATTAACASS